MARSKFEERHNQEEQQQRKSSFNPSLWEEWKALEGTVDRLCAQQSKSENAFAFAFVEGALVSALRSGKWVLLDEVCNRATNNVLLLLMLICCCVGKLGFCRDTGEPERVAGRPRPASDREG